MSRKRRVRGASRKRSGGKFLPILLLLLIIGAGVFAYLSPMFERVAPKIIAPKVLSANAKSPIKFAITDNNSIKSCKVILSNSGKEFTIYSQNFLLPSKKKDIEIKLPNEITKSNVKNWVLTIVAKDSSLWGFFLGNKATKHAKLIVDNTSPEVNLIAQSPTILKGGSALIIFEAKDNNLKSVYIDVGNGIKFKPIKYRKDGVYATLIAWPFNIDNFNPTIIAEDSAKNITKHQLHLNRIYKKYKVSKIRASDRFINGKITELAQSDSDYANIKDKIERFKAVNELMRKKNEDYIHKMSSKVTPFSGKWDIKQFHPLHRAKQVSDFGSKRYYYYGTPDNIISTSYHLGFDLASVKHDNLYSDNNAVVISTKRNGIYGNMPLLDHGFGLYTIYGHCSSILVKKGEKVNAGAVIAKTGRSGLALGDHLHFGVLVQGIEVYPLEWMKKNWIRDHILNIFNKADKIIGYN